MPAVDGGFERPDTRAEFVEAALDALDAAETRRVAILGLMEDEGPKVDPTDRVGYRQAVQAHEDEVNVAVAEQATGAVVDLFRAVVYAQLAGAAES